MVMMNVTQFFATALSMFRRRMTNLRLRPAQIPGKPWTCPRDVTREDLLAHID